LEVGRQSGSTRPLLGERQMGCVAGGPCSPPASRFKPPTNRLRADPRSPDLVAVLQRRARALSLMGGLAGLVGVASSGDS